MNFDELSSELNTIIDGLVGPNNEVEPPYDALRRWQTKFNLFSTDVESKKTSPVMIINLKDMEDGLAVYLKLLNEVERFGVSRDSCTFTWIDDNSKQTVNGLKDGRKQV